jgi:hypothetical protein
VALLIPGLLLITGEPATAADPKLSVAVAAVPGGRVVASGSGFTPGAHVGLSWEGFRDDVPDTVADERGAFEAVVTVPRQATPGNHLLRAEQHSDDRSPNHVATVTVRVVANPSSVNPAPTASPSPTATLPAVPAPQPVATPSATPVPTLAPVVPPPAPTVAPVAPVVVPQPTPAHHTGGPVNPIDCSGYAEPRTLLQIHTWWEGDPVPAGEIAHLHAETCFPLGQTVSGVLVLDTKIVLHNNPGRLARYDSWIEELGGHTVGLDSYCGLGQTCEYWVRTEIDTRVGLDGWYEYRNKPRVRFENGDEQLTSGGWPLYVNNGNAVLSGGFRSGIDDGRGVTGRGWYTDHEYQNPVFVGPVSGVMPGATVSGVWQPNLRLDAGSGGFPSTFSAAYIDANFHQDNEDTDGGGIVLGQWNGPFRGRLPIDTTRLSNGPHQLILRVEAERPDGRLVALQYVTIMVQN